MKVLLIYPYPLYDRSQEEDISVVPVGLYYVGAVLKEAGYEVEILNWHNIHKSPDKIVETFQEKKPDMIGFSILNANRWGGIEIARIAKSLNPNVKVVFGGVGATFLWKHFLTHFPEIDFTVIGEGEYAFLSLVRLVERGSYQRLNRVPGIAYRKGTKVIKTKAARLIKNLDELPIPAHYFKYQHVVSSRGCPGKCTFCGSPRFWGHRIRLRSPESFVEELTLLYNKGVDFFYFSDDTFTINEKRVIEICQRILESELKIVWVAISRADCVNEAILYWMRKAGCIQISYGVESGSEKIRGLLNKHLGTDQIRNAFGLTHRYGILARAYFIYGSPQETWETIEESVKLIKEIGPVACIFYILEIYPGTTLYSEYQKAFKVTDDIWLERMEGICYFQVDASLSQDLVLSFGKRLRSGFFENVGEFCDALDLIDMAELYPMHADFCSRLGMTFSQGDYCKNEAIKGKRQTAQRLFQRALSYAPDHRAYLGLGMLNQDEREFDEAVSILSEGVRHFPDSEPLNVCLAVSCMNLQAYDKALTHLLPFESSKQALRHVAKCYGALGNRPKEEEFLERAHRLEKEDGD